MGVGGGGQDGAGRGERRHGILRAEDGVWGWGWGGTAGGLDGEGRRPRQKEELDERGNEVDEMMMPPIAGPGPGPGVGVGGGGGGPGRDEGNVIDDGGLHDDLHDDGRHHHHVPSPSSCDGVSEHRATATESV